MFERFQRQTSARTAKARAFEWLLAIIDLPNDLVLLSAIHWLQSLRMLATNRSTVTASE